MELKVENPFNQKFIESPREYDFKLEHLEFIKVFFVQIANQIAKKKKQDP